MPAGLAPDAQEIPAAGSAGRMPCAEGEPAAGTSHPDGPMWRGEPFGRAVHSRLTAALEPPAEEAAGTEGEQAEALCAMLARRVLGDFAPALLLLPGTERRRVRALVAFASTLIDHAGRQTFEGERLAQLNRWEHGLETALAGGPAGHPLLRRLAEENQRRRWPADALDELGACARRRVLRRHPASTAQVEAESRSLARAIGSALLEDRINAEVAGFGGALIRLHGLQHRRLSGALTPDLSPRPATPLPTSVDAAGERRASRSPEPDRLAAAIRQECARLRPQVLRAPRGLVDLPTPYRRAGVFCLLAALRLLSDIEEDSEKLAASSLAGDPEFRAGGGMLQAHASPHLSLATRIALLLRARWLGPRRMD